MAGCRTADTEAKSSLRRPPYTLNSVTGHVELTVGPGLGGGEVARDLQVLTGLGDEIWELMRAWRIIDTRAIMVYNPERNV